MKWTTVIAAVLLCCQAPAASAQSIGEPLVIEGGDPMPLAGASPAENALAGDEYLLPFALRNRSAGNAWTRRILFRVPEGMEIVDPLTDRIDNDRDGELDEGDEAFNGAEGTSVAWLGEASDAPLAPGEAIERAVKLRLRPDMTAGSSARLRILATASNGDLSMRAEETVDFDLRPPVLDLTLDDTGLELILESNAAPTARAALSVPSGEISDLALSLSGTPSVDGFDAVAADVGEGLICDSEPVLADDGRTVTAHFGTCRVRPGSQGGARAVWLHGDVRLRDADAFAAPDVIRASRAVEVSARASRGDALVGLPMKVAARIAGPLIGGLLLDTPEDAVDAGDRLAVRLRLSNRGDAVTRGLRLRIADDGAIDCASLRIEGGGPLSGACNSGVALGDLEPETSVELGLTIDLKTDAMFRGGMALRMAALAENMAETPLPEIPYALRLPGPPVISLGDGSEWSEIDGIPTARVGDLGVVEITGTLPEGVYPAQLSLLARSVDAQTGEPLGPAPVIAKSLRFRSHAEAAPVDAAPVVTRENGWTVIAVPTARLAVPVDSAPDAHRYRAVADLLIRDVEEAQAGRVVEITSKLDLFGAVTIEGNTWVEALLVEPAVELTVRSPDRDRSIELGATAEIAAIACNRGLAAARGIVLRAAIPRPLVVTEPAAARFISLTQEQASQTGGAFRAEGRALGEVVTDSGGAVLRGVLEDGGTLEPGSCGALIFSVGRSGTAATVAQSAVIKAALEPFKGREGLRGRLYEGINGADIRFTLPPLRFGPVSEVDVGPAPMIAHEIALTLPRSPGPERVTLKTESSEGLDWTILRIDGSGAAVPWRNGSEAEPGSTLRFRLEARNAGNQPLGWVDTTLVKAAIFPEGSDPIAVTTRLVSRRSEAPGGEISVVKTLALDRDCDGDVGDERVQDALFEPVKDAAVGDCVIFRVAFRHSGDREMEQIVVRDTVPQGTELRAGAVEVLRAPEPLQNVQVLPPKNGERDVVWRFDGLFKPGVEGEVSYAVRLIGGGAGQ